MSKAWCTISFNDGEQMKLKWERPEEANVRAAAMMDQVLNQESIAIEVEGRLLVIPVNSIRTIEVNPAPEKLPPTAVRGAKLG